MHSVFGIGSKRIKTRLIISSKTDPFISFFSYLIHFQTDLNIPRKKNSILPTYPNFLQGVT